MKRRSGFVSNSSSSSFMLATKCEVTKENLLGLFGVSEDSFLFSFAEEIAGFFANVGQMQKFETVEEWRKWCDWMDDERFNKDCVREIRLLKDGWIMYTGSAVDDNGPLEQWICYNSIQFESDDLVLESEGGY